MADTVGTNAPITYGEENNVGHGKVHEHALALQLCMDSFFVIPRTLRAQKPSPLQK